MSLVLQRGIIFFAMAKRPTTKHRPVRRLFRARFPNGASLQRAYIDRVFTHAYLILYERPDAKIGFQRGFCSSLDEAEAKVEEEVRWLPRHGYTLIEACIVEVEDITGKIKNKQRARVMAGDSREK